MNKDDYIKELESIKLDSMIKEKMKEDLYQESLTGFKKKWNFKIISLCIVSACLLLTFSLTYFKHPQQDVPEPTPTPVDPIPDKPIPDDLVPDNPTIPEPSDGRFDIKLGGDGFGMEGYMVKNVSELKKNNPYQMNSPSKKMPVYKNLHLQDYSGFKKDVVTKQEKEALLKEYAQKLGIKTYDITISETYGDRLESDICTISYESSSVFIEFTEKYLRNHKVNMQSKSILEAETIIKKLYQTYQKLFDINNPLYQASYDYDIYGEKHWYYGVSQKTDDQNQSLLNSLARHVVFYKNDNQDFDALRIYRYDLSEKVDDYSIISLDEAKQRLKDNRFLTTVQPINTTEIGFVEMTYIISEYNEYYLPYYKFYVHYEEYEKPGLKTYVACYVSALQDEFIKEDYEKIFFN